MMPELRRRPMTQKIFVHRLNNFFYIGNIWIYSASYVCWNFCANL